jgi:hypothetical protein
MNLPQLLLPMLTLAALSQPARADVVTVGTPDTANCFPFMCNGIGTDFGESINYQQVYSSTAFSGPIQITSETFYWRYAQIFGGSDTLLGGQYAFSLSTTAAPVGGLSPVLSNNLGADNTTVLTFNVPASGESFGTSFTFKNTTPFNYNPAKGNLLLDIVVTDQQNVPIFSGNSYNDADNRGIVTSRAYALRGSPIGFADSIGLVTTFNASTVPEPSAFLPLLGMLTWGVVLLRAARK